MNPIAETYVPDPENPRAKMARWWASEHWLIGGPLLGEEDWDRLSMLHGCEYVVNVGGGRDDGKLPANRLCEMSAMGAFSDEELNRVLKFMKGRYANTRGYVHCLDGNDRAPAVAYFLLRALCGGDREQALKRLNEGYVAKGEWDNRRSGEPGEPYEADPKRAAYLDSVDRWLERNPQDKKK